MFNFLFLLAFHHNVRWLRLGRVITFVPEGTTFSLYKKLVYSHSMIISRKRTGCSAKKKLVYFQPRWYLFSHASMNAYALLSRFEDSQYLTVLSYAPCSKRQGGRRLESTGSLIGHAVVSYQGDLWGPCCCCFNNQKVPGLFRQWCQCSWTDPSHLGHLQGDGGWRERGQSLADWSILGVPTLLDPSQSADWKDRKRAFSWGLTCPKAPGQS